MKGATTKQRCTFHESISQTPPSSGAEWHVLTVIGYHLNWPAKCAWPGLRRITDLTGLDRSTVCRAIAGLEDKGLLKKGTRRGRRCYILPIDPNNRIIGGLDRWRYIEMWAAEMREDGCEIATPVVAETRPPSGRNATPSETPAQVTNMENEHTKELESGGAQVQGEPETEQQGEENPEPPESNPPVPFTQNPGLSPAAKQLIAGIGLYPSSHTEPQDAPVHAQGAQ